MKILLPGIAGGVARVVAEQLVADGHEVIGIDRRPWKNPSKGIEVHNVDIRKRAAEEVFRRVRPDAVVHMATVTHLVARSEERYRINLGGTRAVFDHSIAYGVKQVVFVGRHTYYGAGPDAPLYHTEDDPPMAVTTFPELADLVAADLYAATALWRFPDLCTSVLRICYTLGPTGHGTLSSFLRGPRVPAILGYDPLFQFLSEQDVAAAISLALAKKVRGVFNVAGPSPVPLSVLVRASGRKLARLPEFLFALTLGRFGLPRLPPGALAHIKYPVVVDDAAFRKATGYMHRVDESEAIRSYKNAFPIVEPGAIEART